MVKFQTIQAYQCFEYIFIICDFFHHFNCANFDKINREKALNYQYIFVMICVGKPYIYNEKSNKNYDQSREVCGCHLKPLITSQRQRKMQRNL